MTPASLPSKRRRCATRLLTLGALALAAAVSCAAGPAVASALPAQFGTPGSGAGQISESRPQGIAVDQETGDVYVADTENGRIDKFGPEGEFLLAWGWGVADGETEALQTCAETCFKGLAGDGAGEFFLREGGPEGIAVDNDPFSLSHGDVYVVDPRNNRVQKFGPEGEFKLMFGGEVDSSTKANMCPASEAASCKAGVEGAGPGQFEGLIGRSVAVDSSGVVYVGDRNRVQRFSEEGLVEGEVALSEVGRIQDLALDSAKDIYLWGGLLQGVHKYDPTGTELGKPRDETGFGEALKIVIGPADELVVNDLNHEARHHIFTFTSEGEQTASFDAGSLAENGFAIAYSEHAKALYVLNAGRVRIVTPPPPGPLIVLGSESASEIQPTSASLAAVIDPEGTEATTYHFEYGTTTAYGDSTSEEELKGAAFEDQPADAAITKLQPDRTYHYRVVAKSGAATAEGADQTFTTLPPVSIDGTSVSQVDATSAVLEADLDPHGLPTQYHFEYDTRPYAVGEAPHGITLPVPDGAAGAVNADTTVTNRVQGLLPSTTYHYRVSAHNELGEVVGPDRAFTTQGATAPTLADGRSWEQVSPPNKHGGPLEALTEWGGLIQAAASGGSLTYIARAPVTEDPAGNRSLTDSQLLSTRGATGWSTVDITPPHEQVTKLTLGSFAEYQFFSEDLTSSLVEPEGLTPLSPHTTEKTPYRREAAGDFVPLVTAVNVPPGTKFGPGQVNGTDPGVQFATATPDLSHIVLRSQNLLTPSFKPGFEATDALNLYELSGGVLTLVSVLPNGEPASEAGLSATVGRQERNLRGGISNDGNRVVFTAGFGDVYVRDIALAQTLQVNKRQPGAQGGRAAAVFQAANSAGTKIFFTDEAQLTPDSTAHNHGRDLYMCEVKVTAGHLSCALSDLSVDPNPDETAGVAASQEGIGDVSAIDETGEHVYFAADGVLTSAPNAQGEVAVPGTCLSRDHTSCNLYMYDTSSRQIHLVAVVSSNDSPDWGYTQSEGKELSGLTARTSPDGHYFAFMSDRSLTGYDNRDARSGKPDQEVYMYDALAHTLSCVSCDPSGARPDGVFDTPDYPGLLVDHPRNWNSEWLAALIPGYALLAAEGKEKALYQARYLSDSGRMFFDAADALVPRDTNGLMDVYEFEPPGVGDCTQANRNFVPTSHGCVSLISSGTSTEESAFVDASQSGDDVFFLTASPLAATDTDAALDMYDAHVCSVASPCPPPPPPPPPACQGDACQAASSPPNDTTPGSLLYKGPGNVAPVPHAQSGAKPLTRAQLLVRALKACRKRTSAKKRARCVAQSRRRYAPTAKKSGDSKTIHGTRRHS